MSQSTPHKAVNAPREAVKRQVALLLLFRNLAQINAYLTFDGNCAEAMTFYQSCLGGELMLQPLKGSLMQDQMPGMAMNAILHASLNNKKLVLLGSDLAGPDGIVRGNTVSLSLSCESENEIQTLFERLSSGGQVIHPLHDFFAGTMGTLTDRFDRDWLLYWEK